MNVTTVLIADDHKLLRETLCDLINTDPAFNVIACCADGEEAVEITRAEKPDIVLMDINMPPFSGITATQKIAEFASVTKVIGISAYSDPAYAKIMMKTGASGYITKNSSKDEIFAAMHKVKQGETYVCQEIKNILTEFLISEPQAGQEPNLNSLTTRELQIVHQVKQGLSSKEIAKGMNISLKTVEVHRHNILKKLKLKNAASLVNYVNLRTLNVI